MDLERARMLVYKFAESMTERDLHHQVLLNNYSFTIQHPIHERLTGRLFDCPLHHKIADDPDILQLGKNGWYYVIGNIDGPMDELEWEAV